jgi:lipoprotein-anchoring transpeptidase ErfK/SrfK
MLLKILLVTIALLLIILLILVYYPNPTDSNKVLPTYRIITPTPNTTLKPIFELQPVITSSPVTALESEVSEIPFSQLAPTTVMSFEDLVSDNGDYSEEIPPTPSKDTYKILVNIKYQFITVYTKDGDGEFTVPVRYMICTTGKTSTPTPIGNFETGDDKERFTQFSGNLLWAQYWTQLFDDYYFHSILYSKKDAATYTNSYSKLGTRVSHGCIRLMVPDAQWIYFNIAPGTKVEIIEGTEDEEAAKIREQLVFPPYPNS